MKSDTYLHKMIKVTRHLHNLEESMLNRQLKIDEMISHIANRDQVHESEVRWWSWPEVFGSTNGPHGGVGGQMMTNFQVFGFETVESRMLCCEGKWKRWEGSLQSWNRPK